MQIPYLLILEWVVRLSMAVVIMVRRRSAATASAWLVVVAFVPLVGAVAYFLVGENRLGQRRSRQYERVVGQVSPADHLRERYRRIVQPDLPFRFLSIARLAEAVGAGPPLGGNDLTLLSDTKETMQHLVADIDGAAHHCHLLYYIFHEDPTGVSIAQALLRASQRGVSCRLLADAVGSKKFLSSSLRRDLQRGGVQVIEVMPVNPLRAAVARVDLRNHRKLAVLDGRIAYAGSHNVSEPIYPRKARFGAWVDASVRVEGPAVHLLQDMFLQDWVFNGGQELSDEDLFPPYDSPLEATSPVQVLPTGPSSPEAPLVDVMLQAIRLAESRVVLTTSYFVPDEAILSAMRSAALRGVQVVLVVPKHSDHWIAQAAGRSHYGYLLDVGVEIFEFNDGLLHAKTLSIDRQFAVIGSANLDVRSFMLNFELALLVYDSDFASQVHYLQESYIHRSEGLVRHRWRKRGTTRVLLDNVAKLATPLL